MRFGSWGEESMDDRQWEQELICRTGFVFSLQDQSRRMPSVDAEAKVPTMCRDQETTDPTSISPESRASDPMVKQEMSDKVFASQTRMLRSFEAVMTWSGEEGR